LTTECGISGSSSGMTSIRSLMLLALWAALPWLFPTRSPGSSLATSAFPAVDFLFKADVVLSLTRLRMRARVDSGQRRAGRFLKRSMG